MLVGMFALMFFMHVLKETSTAAGKLEQASKGYEVITGPLRNSGWMEKGTIVLDVLFI